MRRLAAELGVTDRTIRSDITVLTAEHPLQTIRGHGGCVALPDWYRPNKNILSKEQQNVLLQMIHLANNDQARVLCEILDAYGSATRRESK